MATYKTKKFPDTRIATIDICEIGKRKHHITCLVEFDVTDARKKIRKYNQSHSDRKSFTSWLVNTISISIKEYEEAASYLVGKNKLMIFDDINVSIIVEKEIRGEKVPIPLVIEKAQERSIESITRQIYDAKNEEFTDKDIVLQEKSRRSERIYYHLPGFLRRSFWKFLLKHPKHAYERMGNVAITSIGMMGNLNGWFIPISVHPICFGIGSIIKKPSVIDDNIEIREKLDVSILIDHDVIDGAPMTRFVSVLSKNIESGINI